MARIERSIAGKGEMDYDYANDVLFFKTRDREYARSIEFANVVIDIDREGFITGIQIFEASKYLGIAKAHLRQCTDWKFVTRIEGDVIMIRLNFFVRVRNRLVEAKPTITTEVTGGGLQGSQL